MEKRKRGGQPKYSEPTKMVSFRCPISKVTELKQIIKNKLKEYESTK